MQKGMSALPPIATAKADIQWWISEASAFMAPCGGVRRQTGPISSSVACRIKTAFNTLRDKGIELRVGHTLHNYWGDGGLGLSRYQRSNQAHELDRIKHGHCLERRLAESLPRITEIPKKLLTQLVA